MTFGLIKHLFLTELNSLFPKSVKCQKAPHAKSVTKIDPKYHLSLLFFFNLRFFFLALVVIVCESIQWEYKCKRVQPNKVHFQVPTLTNIDWIRNFCFKKLSYGTHTLVKTNTRMHALSLKYIHSNNRVSHNL